MLPEQREGGLGDVYDFANLISHDRTSRSYKQRGAARQQALLQTQNEPGHSNPLGHSNPAATGHEDLSGRLAGSPEFSVPVVDYNQYSPAARSKRISLGEDRKGDGSSRAIAIRSMKPGLDSEPDLDDEFDMERALQRLQQYVEEHPDFIVSMIFWVITGNVLLLVGLVIFLYSEIKMVGVVRSQDTRRTLLETQEVIPSESVKDQAEEEVASVVSRPYLTFAGTILFALGILLALIPLCDVIHLLGLPTGVTCIYIIIFEAVTGALILNFFILGAVWSCTRPWAAMVLMLLALGGMILCPTANVLLMILFLFLAFSVYMTYFLWYPEYLHAQHQHVPYWLESIGSLQITLEHDKWLEAGRIVSGKAWQEAAIAVTGTDSANAQGNAEKPEDPKSS